MLTQKRLQELLSYDSDTGVFINNTQRASCVKIGDVTGSKSANGYVRITIDYKQYYAHRLAWLYVHGEFPKKELDHLNKIKVDNRIINLRLATRQENMQNISTPRSGTTSGFRGVSWSKLAKKWKTYIKINGQAKHLGYFNTAEEASEVYLEAKRALHTFWTEEDNDIL
jgi:hypothetical protein